MRWKMIASIALAGLMTVCAAPDPSSAQGREIHEYLSPEMQPVQPVIIDVECGEPDEQQGACSAQEEKDLPERFDLRDSSRASPVHNQGETALCWAFGTTSSAESYLLGKGISTQLSELQLGYYLENHADDPLGLIAGDKFKLSGNFLTSGGNLLIAANMLTCGIGFAENKDADLTGYMAAPYTLPSALAYGTNAYTSVDCLMTDADDTSRVKQSIMEYGECALSLYYNSEFMNYDSASYFCGADIKAYNHVITLVGWDDTYSRSNFKALPQEDGAWIAKNSWGADWGDGGFFYISYFDSSFRPDENTGAGAGKCMFITADKADRTERVYQHDGGSSNSWIRISSGKAREAAVFSAQSTCILKAISFFTNGSGVSYRVQIYRDIAKGSAPDSGEPCLPSELSGTLSCGGYHTVRLESPLELTKGERFALVISLSSPGELLLPTDTDSDWGWISFLTENRSGECYLCTSDGKWRDVSDEYDSSLKLKCRTGTDYSGMSRIALCFEGAPGGKPASVAVEQTNGISELNQVMYSSALHGGVLWTGATDEVCRVTVSKPGHRTVTVDGIPGDITLTPGDINDDGYINALDSALWSQAMDSRTAGNADINDSGSADPQDLYFILENFAG